MASDLVEAPPAGNNIPPSNRRISTPPPAYMTSYASYDMVTPDSKGPPLLSDNNTFVKIGGNTADMSDPRRIRLGSAQRMKYLKLIDKQSWHYLVMLLLVIDFAVQFLATSFATEREFTSKWLALTDYVPLVSLFVYTADMVLRLYGLRSSFFQNSATVLDVGAVVALIGLLIVRLSYREFSFEISILTVVALSVRIVVKPRSRQFTKKLHEFGIRGGDFFQVGMDSVRICLRRIPGVSASAIEMMEMDLFIICGRDGGEMTSNELMQFLERALLYRPRDMSASEFLSYLQDINTHSERHVYSAVDVVRSTLYHWRSQKMDLGLSLFVVCVNGLVIPLQSFLIGWISDKAILVDENQEDKDRDILNQGVLGILLLVTPFIAANYGIGYFQSKMISKATEIMQQNLLDIILQQDAAFFAMRSEGDLNNLFSSDIARVNALWQSVFWNLLNPLVSVIFGFGFIVIYDWPTGVLAFAFTTVLLSSGPQGFAGQRSKEFGKKNAFVSAEFQNAIACNKLIRAYDIRIPFSAKFAVTIDSLRETAFNKDMWASIVQIYVESAMYIFVATQLASLLIKTFDGEIKIGTLFAFVALLSRISTPVTTLGGFMRVAIGNSSSLQRLDDILMGVQTNFSGDGGGGEPYPPRPDLPPMKLSLALRNVYFKYDPSSDIYNISNMSLNIRKGSYVCIVGPSGSGKSTLLNLLLQFNTAESGSIDIDGVPITNYSFSSVKKSMAVVFQDIFILNGSILENIRYGNCEATDQECYEAASLAECHFITLLKDGFATIIGQHSTTSLSGGQAQRVCLARALCRRPSVLLLDEATSALDIETEASIIATLEKLTKKIDTTIVAVTHRLQTTLNADAIYVMDNGELKEFGTHEELKSRENSLFSEMMRSLNRSPQADGARKHSRGSFLEGTGAVATADDGTPIMQDHDVLEKFSRHLQARIGETSTDPDGLRRRFASPRLSNSGNATVDEFRWSAPRTVRDMDVRGGRDSGQSFDSSEWRIQDDVNSLVSSHDGEGENFLIL